MVTPSCYNVVATTRPLQMWLLQPGHYKLATGHYEFTTTWPLQTCYYTVTTTPLQPCYNTIPTTVLLQPCYNTIPTTVPLQSCHSPVTMLQSGHYNLATMVILWQYYNDGHTLHHLTVLYNIFQTMSLFNDESLCPMSFHSFLTIKCHLTCTVCCIPHQAGFDCCFPSYCMCLHSI